MNVVVFMKQVPDTARVQVRPGDNTLVREGVESIANPYDEYALEQALALKDSHAADVKVVSMGPSQASAVLRGALARGADEAYLVSSPAFAGADTLATSYVLSLAAMNACGGRRPDLVLFGRQAIDGDTAQVGPEVSEFLDMPLVAYVRSLRVDAESGHFVARTSMDDGEHLVKGALPVVMTVLKEAAPPRFASLHGAMEAAKRKIEVLDERDIGADTARIGLSGSPTRVVDISPPPSRRCGRVVVWNGDASLLASAVEAAMNG